MHPHIYLGKGGVTNIIIILCKLDPVAPNIPVCMQGAKLSKWEVSRHG